MKRLKRISFLKNWGRAGAFACAVAVALSVAFTACSNDEDDNSQPPAEEKTTDPVSLPSYTDFDAMAEFMYQAIKLCHPKMQEVWPHADVKAADFNMMLVRLPESESGSPKAYSINAAQKTTFTDFSNEAVKKALSDLESAGFVKLVYNGTNMTMMNSLLGEDEVQRYRKKGYQDIHLACEILDTFYHESFHFYVQANKWTAKKPNGNREQEYPIVTEPRKYRILTDLALIQAYDNYGNETERNKQYARAKYWLNKYKTGFSDEAAKIQDTDISEGTANYFGRSIVSSVFPSYKAIALFERPEGDFLAENIDGESYVLGSVSLNLIKKQGKISEVIAASIAGTYTPAEFLLKDISTPYTESAVDGTDIARINAAWKKLQDQTAPLETLINGFTGGGATYLVVYSEYTSSAGIYKFTQNDMKEFCGIIKFGISTNEIAVNGENNICCLNADLKIAGTDRRGYFFIPITDGASVTFEEETVTDKTIEIYPDSLPDSVKLADFTELKAGKITAVTRDGVTLKEPAKTKTAYKGTYRNNTFYCLPDTSAGGENTDSL